MADDIKRRPPIVAEVMTAVELLCQAIATLYEAQIINREEARRMLAEYGMEPREESSHDQT
jgi:hypothetical protein